MKLVTLNTHSLVEENYAQKLLDFTGAIAEEKPDIIALQEVNQTSIADIVPHCQLKRFHPPIPESMIRIDNHAYQTVKMLAEKGLAYNWTWLGIKQGYGGKYEEGLSVLSRSDILETDILTVSDVDDYANWKTRKLLGIRTREMPDAWFTSVHFSWWNDMEEPFERQWERTERHMKRYGTVWLMGDFNNPAEVRQEGYDLVQSSGWYDSYLLAARKDTGVTVTHVIDGWKDKIRQTNGMRIDQIWCSQKLPVKSAEVLFDGSRYPVVSDHCGVMIEI